MPNNYAEIYHRSIAAARQKLFTQNGLPRQAEQMLLRLFAKTVRDIIDELQSGDITEERADELIDSIKKRLTKLGIQLSYVLRSAKLTAINTAIQAHSTAIAELSSITTASIATDFSGVQDEVLELMMMKRGLSAKNYQSIIKRNMQHVADQIDDFINSAILRGVSSDRAAAQLAADFVGRNHPELKDLITDKGLTKAAINAAIENDELSLMSIDDAKKAYYDAKRIMVTETNSAYRTADIVSQKRSPVVKASKWQLSGRHDAIYPGPGAGDECDIFAKMDFFGLGPGIYPVGNMPSHPHPHCQCLSVSVVLDDPSKWGEDAGVPTQKPPEFTEAEAEQFFEDKTDHYIETVTEQVNLYNNLAYQAEIGISKVS